MTDSKMISFEEAKKQLDTLMLNSSTSIHGHILSYAINKWMSIKTGSKDSGMSAIFSFPNSNTMQEAGTIKILIADEESLCEDNEDILDDPVAILNSIVKEIRTKVPLDAIFPSEIITVPKKGEVRH